MGALKIRDMERCSEPCCNGRGELAVRDSVAIAICRECGYNIEMIIPRIPNGFDDTLDLVAKAWNERSRFTNGKPEGVE